MMEYLTTAEQAKLWNISQRRVSILCKEGRVEGAVLKGKTWLIPEGAKKPRDPRKKEKIGVANGI
jgi:DNA adenine methylase